jgi:hypothetical protein
MLQNVDAVVWIDYTKANQPPGSIKMGPFESRPYSRAHVEIVCVEGLGMCSKEHDDISETRSEIEEAQDGDDTTRPERPSEKKAIDGAATVDHTALREDTKLVSKKKNSIASVVQVASEQVSRKTAAVSAVQVSRKTAAVSAEQVSRKTAAVSSEQVSRKTAAVSAGGGVSGDVRAAPQKKQAKSPRKVDEKSAIRSIMQEEFIPVHDSIYYRSIAPGPGYYAVNSTTMSLEDRSKLSAGNGCSFGSGHIKGSGLEKPLPGPGQYQHMDGFDTSKANLGGFGKSAKLVSPIDSIRKLPFISPQAAILENYGLHSPGYAHIIPPHASHATTRGHVRAPLYSFSQARRPF